MKKSYIAPEIKTMIIDNVVMAATSSGETTTDTFSLGSQDNYATDLGNARSRQSSSWDDED